MFPLQHPPCVDASAMNSSSPGDGGRTYIVGQQYILSRKITHDHLVYIECTPRWPSSLLLSSLAPLDYTVKKFLVDGNSVGDRYNRKRGGTLALHPDLVFISSFEDYLLQAGHATNPDFTPDMFFDATVAEEEQ